MAHRRQYQGKILELNDWQDAMSKRQEDAMRRMSLRIGELSQLAHQRDMREERLEKKMDKILHYLREEQLSAGRAAFIHERLNDAEEMWGEMEGLLGDLREKLNNDDAK